MNATAASSLENIQQDAEEWVDQAGTWVAERATEADDQVRRLVTERPLVALFGATAIGYLVGRLMSRR